VLSTALVLAVEASSSVFFAFLALLSAPSIFSFNCANTPRSPKVDFSTDSFTFLTAVVVAFASFFLALNSSLRSSAFASSQIRA
jgi:hypothetical protein